MFGPTIRPLTPLHSLSDFCYAVRRDVVVAIGGADQGYGLGPCWEMDYNIRAARAGYVGLWACGAYVHRSPLTQRRVADETDHQERNRRRYQDRLCGLRLSSTADRYEPHCRGDDCEHFAPAHLIGLHLPVGTIGAPTIAPAPAPIEVAVAPPASVGARSLTAPTDAVLVSCVMPTRGRTRFAVQAARYFQQQDYPRLELIIVEDGDALLADALPDDPRIRLISSGSVRSIGTMRNDACAHAAGEVLVLWDDDDWHAPDRVTQQVAPILAGEADITALRDVPLLDLGGWRTWRWSPDMHRRMLALDVLGGTLAFRRSMWEQCVRFPDDSLAEDAAFLREAVAAGARLQPVAGAELYVYIRHGANSWQLECGESEDPTGWMSTHMPLIDDAAVRFYRDLVGAGAAPDEPEQVMEP
jgi:hypothetical protein